LQSAEAGLTKRLNGRSAPIVSALTAADWDLRLDAKIEALLRAGVKGEA
jgi:hypothetical protein